jgi:hypothetical protein
MYAVFWVSVLAAYNKIQKRMNMGGAWACNLLPHPTYNAHYPSINTQAHHPALPIASC